MINIENYTEMADYLLEQYPNEACGILKDNRFIPITNTATNPTEAFEFHPAEWFKLKDQAQAIVHSHCFSSTRQPHLGLDGRTPSTTDFINQKKTNLPWIIFALDGENISEPVEFPQSRDRELLGRPFIYLISDCWNVVQDYYHQRFQITLPDHPIEDGYKWEENRDGRDGKNYFDYLLEWGFKEVRLDDMQIGDIIVMSVRGKCNHVGVYYEENYILQQLAKNVSCTLPINKMASFINHIFRKAE
jgi:proteasome lid subunit RPN8/RPN11